MRLDFVGASSFARSADWTDGREHATNPHRRDYLLISYFEKNIPQTAAGESASGSVGNQANESLFGYFLHPKARKQQCFFI